MRNDLNEITSPVRSIQFSDFKYIYGVNARIITI